MPTKVITITMHKGGVGKTTLATNLGHSLALSGKNVLIIDLDPQGCVARQFGMKPERGVFVWATTPLTGLNEVAYVKTFFRTTGRDRLAILPGNGETANAQIIMGAGGDQYPISFLRDNIRPFTKNGLDYIIFDTSPSMGGLQERAVFAADYVLIPCSTQYGSLESMPPTLSMIKTIKNRGWQGGILGIIPTKFDVRNNENKRSLEQLRETFGDLVMPEIHEATVVAESWANGQTIFERDHDSRAAVEYRQISEKVLKTG